MKKGIIAIMALCILTGCATCPPIEIESDVLPADLMAVVKSVPPADQPSVLSALLILVNADMFVHLGWAGHADAHHYQIETRADVSVPSAYILMSGKTNSISRVRGFNADGVPTPWDKFFEEGNDVQ